MKKILIYVLSLFLLTASALATSLNVPNSVEFYAEQDETISQDFTIKNDGELELTDMVFNFENVDPEYDACFSEESNGTYKSALTIDSLAVDASKKIYVRITIPDDETGSNEIGNILITNDEISESIPLTEHIGGLDIIDFDVKVGKRKEALDIEKDGDLIKSDYTRPGEPIVFEIDIENLFSEDSKNEIKDIEIKVAIIGIDDGEDLEEESDNIDFDPEKSHRETFEFSIPIEVEEDEYDVTIDIEGKDDQDIDREIHWTLKLEVEKKSHDVKIRSASLNPTKIICGGTSVLSTTIYNFGTSTEDDVKLTIKNSDLGINIIEESIELDNDLFEDESKLSKIYSIPVSKTQKSGTYSIDMWVYFDKDETVRADYRKLELVVESCPEEPKEAVCGNSIIETGEECDDGNTVNNDGCSALCKTEEIEEEEKEEQEEEQITGGTVITETKETGVAHWIIALVGVNVLVLIIIIVMVIFMFRKKGGEILEE